MWFLGIKIKHNMLHPTALKEVEFYILQDKKIATGEDFKPSPVAIF